MRVHCSESASTSVGVSPPSAKSDVWKYFEKSAESTRRNVHYVQNYYLTVGERAPVHVIISPKLAVRSKQHWTCFPSPSIAQRLEQKIFTDLIVNMLALDLRSVYMMECEGFKDLVACLEPGYTVPSHKLITSMIR